MWHTSTNTPHPNHPTATTYTNLQEIALDRTAFLCGMRRWSKKSSATDLKLISCDRDNLTRSVWHSRCYHADTKSRARRYSPFKTVCFQMVTVPGWHKFQHVTWALPKRTYALSPASTGLWIPAPGGQLSLSTHVWQSSRMKHGFVLALGLWTSSPCTDSIRLSAHWRLVLDSTIFYNFSTIFYNFIKKNNITYIYTYIIYILLFYILHNYKCGINLN